MPWPGTTSSFAPAWFGSRFGEIADPDTQPAWRDLDIGTVDIGGRACMVRERRRILTPFATVTDCVCNGRETGNKCLLVMAQSGHFSFIMRDLIAGLLCNQDVSVLDWTNARHIPPAAGRFGFKDTIATIISALRTLGPRPNLIGVCQSALPAIAATLALHDAPEASRPASLTLIGAPVDPLANPTRVATMLTETPIGDIAKEAITVVPAGFEGAGREVFAARTQQCGLLTYLTRHFWEFGSCMQKIFADDGRDADRYPFLTLFTSLKDIPSDAFLESIHAIYQDRFLWSQEFKWDGHKLDPACVDSLPLMTIEAERDDIAAPGQTFAAHRLFKHVPEELRRHFLLRQRGHFSLFHGRACRDEVVPAINRFLQSAGTRNLGNGHWGTLA